MPGPDDRMTTGPEPGSPAAHPVLEDMAEAVRLTSYAAGFLSPTRMFDEPGLEDDDWPRDLDGPETLQMLRYLADIAGHADTCVNGISCQHSIADAAKPELGEIGNLLVEVCRRLSALEGNPGSKAQAVTPSQDAAGRPAAPRRRTGSATGSACRARPESQQWPLLTLRRTYPAPRSTSSPGRAADGTANSGEFPQRTRPSAETGPEPANDPVARRRMARFLPW